MIKRPLFAVIWFNHGVVPRVPGFIVRRGFSDSKGIGKGKGGLNEFRVRITLLKKWIFFLLLLQYFGKSLALDEEDGLLKIGLFLGRFLILELWRYMNGNQVSSFDLCIICLLVVLCHYRTGNLPLNFIVGANLFRQIYRGLIASNLFLIRIFDQLWYLICSSIWFCMIL